MDPILYVKREIRKAQINGDCNVVAVFFDIENVYDMMWKDGLLVKLGELGVKGSMCRRIKDFVF